MGDQTVELTIPDEVYAAGELAAKTQLDSETGWHAAIYAAVRAAITTFVADRAVIALPKPDDTDNEGDPLWDLGSGQVVIAYCDTDGHPMIRLPDGEDVDPEWASLYATVLAAGVRASHVLAAAFAERMAETAAALEELVDQGLVVVVEGGGVDG